MFTDPQSVTVNSVPQSLPAISREELASLYRKDDGSYTLKISHQEGARNRRVVRIEHTKTATDPLTAQNATVGMSVYMVIDAPPWGYTNTELKDIALGLTGWASSANILKVLGGES